MIPSSEPVSGRLLPNHQHCKEHKPCQAHGMPVPGRDIYRDLPQFYALEPVNDSQTREQRENSNNQVGGVQPGDDVEEITCRG